MNREEAKNKVMTIYGSLSEDMKQAIDVLVDEKAERIDIYTDTDIISRHDVKSEFADYYGERYIVHPFYRRLDCIRPAQIDLSSYSDRLWKSAYERGKADGQEWIPVTEKLPKDDGEYLLYGMIAEDEEEDYAFIGRYDACAERFGYWRDYYHRETLGFLDSELIEYNKVLAWMPLPESYKADKGANDNADGN